MKRERTNYSKEFKQKAIELSIQRGNQTEVARELNITPKHINRWKREQNQTESGKQLKSVEQEEILRLKKELYEAKLERDILKKAVSIFSKSDR